MCATFYRIQIDPWRPEKSPCTKELTIAYKNRAPARASSNTVESVAGRQVAIPQNMPNCCLFGADRAPLVRVAVMRRSSTVDYTCTRLLLKSEHALNSHKRRHKAAHARHAYAQAQRQQKNDTQRAFFEALWRKIERKYPKTNYTIGE